MKKLFPLLGLFLFSNTLLAQKTNPSKRAEYERVFTRLAKFYNNIQADSINELFLHDNSWTPSGIMKSHQELGKIVSFKYIGPFKQYKDTRGQLMRFFKVTFDKPAQYGENGSPFNGKRSHAVDISLDENNKIYGIGFITSSEDIDSMITHY